MVLSEMGSVAIPLPAHKTFDAEGEALEHALRKSFRRRNDAIKSLCSSVRRFRDAMPIPVSLTTKLTRWPSWGSARISTRPPSKLNLIALGGQIVKHLLGLLVVKRHFADLRCDVHPDLCC